MTTRSYVSSAMVSLSAWRRSRPRSMRASIGTPYSAARCSIASSSGMAMLHWRGSGVPPGEMQRPAREEEGDERGAFRAGETQRGVERRLGQPARREREEDAPARAADCPRASRAVAYLGHDERYEREREQRHVGDEHGGQ